MRENEKELLNLAKSKDTGAVEQVLAKYKHLVVAIARKYFLIGGDKEDLIQEGMIGLFKAVNTFDVDKSDNFSGYAVMLIEREIISVNKKHRYITSEYKETRRFGGKATCQSNEAYRH